MNLFDTGLLPISIFVSALFGSVHCLGMCGPIVTVTNQNSIQSLYYQIGRLTGYLFLAIIAASLGHTILSFFPRSWTSLIAPLFLGITFITLGVLMLLERKFHLKLPSFISRPLHYFINKKHKPLAHIGIGFFTISLPCGWLYGYVLGAGASGDISKAMLIMFMFWLGTAPSLVFTPWLMKNLIYPVKKKFPYLSAMALIFLGGFILTKNLYKNPSVQIESTTTESQCDLQKSACTIETKDYGPLTLEISPRPIRLNEKMKIQLTSQNEISGKVEIDFKAKEMDMGYHRLELKRDKKNRYSTSSALPSCHSEMMTWQAAVFINQRKSFVLEFITTKN